MWISCFFSLLPYEHQHCQVLEYFWAAIVSDFTEIGQQATSHQHMSYQGKVLDKWEHPDILAKYRAFPSNFSAGSAVLVFSAHL